MAPFRDNVVSGGEPDEAAWYSGMASPSIIQPLCWAVIYDNGEESEELFQLVHFPNAPGFAQSLPD